MTLWLVCATSLAKGEETSKAVRASLELAAPAGCGDRALLISRITRRSERIRIDEEPAPRRVRVSIDRAGDALRVELTFQQPNGRRASRTLRASTCDEAVEAAALVAALSLDPSASTAPENELPAAPAPIVTGQGEPEPSAPTRPQPAEEGARTRASERQLATAAPSVAWSAALLLAATWQPAPAPMPGVGLSLAVRDERPRLVAPSARVTLAHFGRSGFSASRGVGEASFQLESATLELCPLRVRAWRLGVAPCGFANAGVLRVAGFGALDARRVTRPWWVFGGSAVAVFPLSERLQLEAATSVAKPVIRDAFQFEPLVVHSVRPWVVTLGLGAGFVFR